MDVRVMSASCLHASKFFNTASYTTPNSAHSNSPQTQHAAQHGEPRARDRRHRTVTACASLSSPRPSVLFSPAFVCLPACGPRCRACCASCLNAAAMLRSILKQIGNAAAHVAARIEQSQQTAGTRTGNSEGEPCARCPSGRASVCRCCCCAAAAAASDRIILGAV